MSTHNQIRLMPECSQNDEQILGVLRDYQANDLDLRSIKNFRPVYFPGDDVLDLMHKCHELVLEQNVLYASASYQSIVAIERDLIGFAADLLNAPPGAIGTVTVGGSESNFVAIKTARDHFSACKAANVQPEIVLPHTAHPSLEKAAVFMGIKVRRAKTSDNWRANIGEMAGLITDNTMMIVGSAPPAAYGTVDPIPEINALAREHDLWMHVDGCMGGYFLPFAEALGEQVPVFDFRNSNVMSISADLHKFGYAPKGVSTVLFRDPAMHQFRNYVFDQWPFGHYETEGVAGSRPAFPMVAAWATIRKLGRQGFLTLTRETIALRDKLIRGIRAIDGLDVIGEPAAAHLFLYSDMIDVYALDERLEAEGYRTARAVTPDAIQFWVNPIHDETAIDTLLADLHKFCAEIAEKGVRAKSREAAYTR